MKPGSVILLTTFGDCSSKFVGKEAFRKKRLPEFQSKTTLRETVLSREID